MCCQPRKPTPAAVARAPRRAAVRPAHLCRGQGGRGCRCHQRGRRANAAPRVAQPRDRMPPRRPAEAAAEPPGRPQGPPDRFFDPDINANRKGIPCNTQDRLNFSLTG